mmetsp:Transcript_13954/g.38054  ORF Transcript_13954/g.38054 Transcript_13954/m.38054 type:complete len:107 (-) Transcript_13954:5-325(-)
MDEFCLTTLITAYTLARPRATERAEAAVREYVAEGNDLALHPANALRRCVGAARFEALLEELGMAKVQGSHARHKKLAAVRLSAGREACAHKSERQSSAGDFNRSP